jgi:hypothetical protein
MADSFAMAVRRVELYASRHPLAQDMKRILVHDLLSDFLEGREVGDPHIAFLIARAHRMRGM